MISEVDMGLVLSAGEISVRVPDGVTGSCSNKHNYQILTEELMDVRHTLRQSLDHQVVVAGI